MDAQNISIDDLRTNLIGRVLTEENAEYDDARLL